ncbi:TniQ family protein [archaeon]|nr:TniQ family protein [archaeon]
MSFPSAVASYEVSGEWTIHPTPIEGELLSSWVCRLARAKCLDSNLLLPGLRMYNRDIDINSYEWLVPRLVEHTRVPKGEIEAMLLGEWDKLLHQFKRRGYPYGITGRPNYKNKGIRLCPICLKEDSTPFYRRIWRIGAVTACTKHKTLLVDRCPKCGSYIDPKRVKWNASYTSCFNCGYELTEAPVHRLSARDPFMAAAAELSLLEHSEKHVKVFRIVKLLGESSSPDDSFYRGHPLTKIPVVREAFDGDRRDLFTSVETVFLAVGAARTLLNDRKKLDPFLRENNSCIKHFWTDRPYCCHLDHHQGFKTKYNFDRHSDAHNGIRPYACTECGERFTQKAMRDRHVDKKRCKKKAYTFSKKHDMLTHLKTHAEKKEFVCPECREGFAHKTYFKEHLNIHKDKRPNKCPECGDGFNFKTYLNAHIRKKHLKEMMYECPDPECGREFAWRSALVRHVRVHSGERPYKCPKCGDKFRYKYSLDKHVNDRCKMSR